MMGPGVAVGIGWVGSIVAVGGIGLVVAVGVALGDLVGVGCAMIVDMGVRGEQLINRMVNKIRQTLRIKGFPP